MASSGRGNGRGNGRVVVITGASSGIGRATALRFARDRVSLVLAARGEEALADAAKECEVLGARALAVPCDVSREDQVEALARRAIEVFGRVDAWINNAGVLALGTFEETPREAFRQVVETNFFGVVHGCRAAVPILRAQGKGVIVNVSSTFGRVAVPDWSAYCASKFAVRGFTEALRQELRPHSVEVCCVFPAAIDTPFWQHAANYTGREVKALRPVFDPEKVAAAIVQCVRSPRGEIVVGYSGHAVAATHDVSTALWNRIATRFIAANQFADREAPVTEGNVWKPLHAHLREVEGGWRHAYERRVGRAA